MALASIGASILLPFEAANPNTTSTGSLTTQDTAAAANSGFGVVFQVPKTGTIDRIGIYLNAVTTGSVMVASFQTISSGLPSGSNYGGSSPQNLTVTTATPGYYEAVFSTPVSATEGDIIAACVNQPATSFGSCANAKVAGIGTQYPLDAPGYVSHNGTTWARGGNTNPLAFTVGYSSTDYINYRKIGFPVSAAGVQTIGTGATFRRIGHLFTPTFKMRCRGMWFKTVSTVRDCTLVLYDSAGTTALATSTVTAATWNNLTTTGGGILLDFDSGTKVTLTPGTQYRAAYVANSASTISIATVGCPTVGQMSAFPMGPNISMTTYNGTVWDDTATSTLVMGLGIVVDQLDDGAGGGTTGILVNSRMTGGMS